MFYKVEQIFDQECESPIYVISIEEYQPLGLFKMSTMKNVTILLYILEKHNHVNYKQTIKTKKLQK